MLRCKWACNILALRFELAVRVWGFGFAQEQSLEDMGHGIGLGSLGLGVEDVALNKDLRFRA